MALSELFYFIPTFETEVVIGTYNRLLKNVTTFSLLKKIHCGVDSVICQQHMMGN